MADRVSFPELYDRLTEAGVSVGVAERDGDHDIVCWDGTGRRARLRVVRCFDRTAAVFVASMRLRETIGTLPDHVAVDSEVRGSWPEFEALWPLEFEARAE